MSCKLRQGAHENDENRVEPGVERSRKQAGGDRLPELIEGCLLPEQADGMVDMAEHVAEHRARDIKRDRLDDGEGRAGGDADQDAIERLRYADAAAERGAR